MSEKASFYAMESDLLNSRAITACGDRKIRIYDVVNGKEIKALKGSWKGPNGVLCTYVLFQKGNQKGLFVFIFHSSCLRNW